MPTFKYSAMQGDGRTISGVVEAPNKQECVAELRKRNLTPLDIEEGGGASGEGTRPREGRAPRRRAGPSGSGPGCGRRKSSSSSRASSPR